MTQGQEQAHDRVERDDAEWREQLDPVAYRVTRQAGTERPFTGRYVNEKRAGKYRCVCCGAPLFGSDAKYDSRSGWPSFWEPQEDAPLETEKDVSHGMVRTEVKCARCDAHLGHLFDDGPEPTGERYCINSAALEFEPAESAEPSGE